MRDAIGRALQAHVKSDDLAPVCIALGMVVPDPNAGLIYNSKWATVRSWLPHDRESVLSIAKRVLEQFWTYRLEELVWAAQEESVEFSELTRRNLLATLSSLPAPWGKLGLNTVVGEVIQLDESLRNATLSESELQDVQGVSEQCGVLGVSDRRFRALVERMVHPSVRGEEDQRKYVDALSAELRKSGWDLHATGLDAGRTLYSVVRATGGVGGRPKQIIFASQVKPDLRFADAINGDIEIVRFADKVLVYDHPIPPTGLLWRHLQEWWAATHGLVPEARATRVSLYQRLRDSLPKNSPPQRLLFEEFFSTYQGSFGELPALLPEVWLYYDPLTVSQRGRDALLRQRMDFLMLFSQSVRVVIEVDGVGHYCDPQGKASPSKYAEMVAADRDLRLSGYEVYRFGGKELEGDLGREIARGFFRLLFRRHGVEAEKSR
ncbi:hypothetical protein OV207_17625 [Corallococcus sp. BB11-1]|uniref:AbiJ-related protein n=1 Tax=Corallococcus sp. BB11-1 TaxID=2996783 RepID=UPI00226E6108|nr:hypothetical protein [Corallococcus sp. BB11-1]MCY1033278.1 hypothetical protein [Corallococcus sp. BB11-1]